METTIIADLLKQGGYYAILVGTLYYFLAVYIPRKDEMYEKRIDSIQNTFKESMTVLADKLDSRLKEIEDIISKKR